MTPEQLQAVFDAYDTAYAARKADKVSAAAALATAKANLEAANAALVQADAANAAAVGTDKDATHGVVLLTKALTDSLEADDPSVFWSESGLTPPSP